MASLPLSRLLLLTLLAASLAAEPLPVSPPRLAGAFGDLGILEVVAGWEGRILTLWGDQRGDQVVAFTIADSELVVQASGAFRLPDPDADAAANPDREFTIAQRCRTGPPISTSGSVCVTTLDGAGRIVAAARVAGATTSWVDIATAADGTSLVVWTEESEATTSIDGVLLDASLQVLARLDIVEDTQRTYMPPRVVAAGDRFTVAWREENRLLAVDVDRSGSTSEPVVLEWAADAAGVNDFDLAARGDETLIAWSRLTQENPSEVYWRIRNGDQWGPPRKVFARRPLSLSVAGGAEGWLIAFPVGNDEVWEPIGAFIRSDGEAELIRPSEPDASGMWDAHVVPAGEGFAWIYQPVQSQPNFKVDRSVVAGRHADARGRLVGTETLLSVSIAAQQQPAAVWGVADGLVAWSERHDWNRWRVRATRIDSAGRRIGTEDLVVPFEGRDQVRPSVAFGGSVYLLLWIEAEDDSNGTLKGMRIASDGTPIDAEPLVVAADADPHSSVSAVWNGSEWLVAWADEPSSRLAATFLSQDGTTTAPALLTGDLAGRRMDSDPALLWRGDHYFLAWSAFADVPGCQITCPFIPRGAVRLLQPDLQAGEPLDLGLGESPRAVWNGAEYGVALTGPLLARVSADATSAETVRIDWRSGRADVLWSEARSEWHLVWSDGWRPLAGNLYRSVIRDFESKPAVVAIAETDGGEDWPILLPAPEPLLLYELRSAASDWVPVVVSDRFETMAGRVIAPSLLAFRSSTDEVTLRWTNPIPDADVVYVEVEALPGVFHVIARPPADETTATVSLHPLLSGRYRIRIERSGGGWFTSNEVVVGRFAPRSRTVGR